MFNSKGECSLRCRNCGNQINDSAKFCMYCGKTQKEPVVYKIFSSKLLLILFLVAHFVSTVEMTGIDFTAGITTTLYSFGAAILMSFLMLLINPFLIASIIFCVLNIENYKKWRGICCLIFSILLVLPTIFINALTSIENAGIFSSPVLTVAFFAQSFVVTLVCGLNLVFMCNK